MKFILALVVTIGSYIFADDPNPDPKFINLTFWGRYGFFLKQADSKEVKDFMDKLK